MTSTRNARPSRSGSRAQAAASPQRAGEAQVDLRLRLRRMADEVEHLQSEIAAFEALVVEAPAAADQRVVEERVVEERAVAQRAVGQRPQRPGAGWKPTPTPPPWLEVRSA